MNQIVEKYLFNCCKNSTDQNFYLDIEWVYYSCRAFWFKEQLFNYQCSGSHQVCTMFPMKCYVLWWRVQDTKDSYGIFISKEALKYFISFFSNWIYLIYEVVLVSGVWQSDSVIHTYIHIFSDSFSLWK